MKRFVWPVALLVIALIGHFALGAVLVKQEPLAAVLTGRYWVVAVAVSLLGVRLAILFALVPWLLYRALVSLAARVRA